MYTHTHAHTTHKSTHTCYAYAHIQICTHMCVCTVHIHRDAHYTYTYTHISTHAHKYTSACARLHAQTYTHTYKCTHIWTHTQQTEYSKYPGGSCSKSDTLSEGKLRLFLLILVSQMKPFPSHIWEFHGLTAGLLPTSQADTYLTRNPVPSSIELPLRIPPLRNLGETISFNS